MNQIPWFLDPAAVPAQNPCPDGVPNCNCVEILRRLEFDVWWFMKRLMFGWMAATFNRHETEA